MQRFRFRDLIDPLSPAEFFARVHGRESAHLPGQASRFAGLFSWAELNRLLDMTTLWTDRSMKVVLDGRTLTPNEICRPVQSRDGHPAMRPDADRVAAFLARGATVVLDLAERLSPGLAALTDVLESTLGAPASCNVYCSFKGHRGFPAHFDTMDVFALQIEGSKTWRLYEGRFEHPLETPGYNYPSLPRTHHEAAKGRIERELTLEPGHVLYLPKGRYHDALAASEASLHLSFGITEATGQDLMATLIKSLPDDPLFRRSLPHFDDRQAHEAHLRRLGERLCELLAEPDTSAQMRAQQRRRALRDASPGFRLPDRAERQRYRVRVIGVRARTEGGRTLLEVDDQRLALAGEESAVARWVLERDRFAAEELEVAFPELDADVRARTLGALESLGLVARA